MTEPIVKLKTPRLDFHHTRDILPDPADFERHCHDSYEIICTVEGTGRYIAEGANFSMKANTLLLLPPGVFHYVDPHPERPYERYVFHFHKSSLPEEILPLLSGYEGEGAEQGHFYSGARLNAAVSASLSRLNEVAQFSSERGELLVRLILSELLLFLSSASADRIVDTGEPLGLQVVRYLNAHLTEQISLDALARRFYVSKFYLCRAFREQNGVSVLQYMTEKRVLLAKKMLGQGESAVAVAARTGFGDYSSFYRAYRKLNGCAPKHSKSVGHTSAEEGGRPAEGASGRGETA